VPLADETTAKAIAKPRYAIYNLARAGSFR
jgi:hypothetical protein